MAKAFQIAQIGGLLAAWTQILIING